MKTRIPTPRRQQSVPVARIVVFQNQHYVNSSAVLSRPENSDVRFVHNVNYNTGALSWDNLHSPVRRRCEEWQFKHVNTSLQFPRAAPDVGIYTFPPAST